jgi:predicted permease
MMHRSDDDFDREIRSHLELETERLIDEGHPPDEARRLAHARFGSVAVARERFYEARHAVWLDRIRLDVRGAMRSIRRYPVAAGVAILSLGAAIGAMTVTLTVRDIVFYKAPPAYTDPGQLSRVQVGSPAAPIMPVGSHVPAELYRIWMDTLGPSIAASTSRGVRDVRAQDRTETVSVRAATPELFSVLGVSPILGQHQSRSTSAKEGARAALLSYRLWQRLFDLDPGVVGRVVWIDNQPYTVSGVLPKRFWFGEMNSPIWTVLDEGRIDPSTPLEVVVRRPPDVTPDMLAARLQGGLTEYARRLPAAERQLRLLVSGIGGTPLARQVAVVLPYVLGACVLLTLLIACANAAILMIAQWTSRTHEIAIRASIGASRARIVRGLLTESVLVALAAGALGVCAAFMLRGWVIRSGGESTALYDLSVNPVILLQAIGIAFATGIITGIAPALYETRRLHANPLRALDSSDRVRQRWRHALVVLEIAVTVALLVVTASLIDGYRRARTADLGFTTAPLLSARVENPAGVRVPEILELVNRLPGVAAAAASTMVPFTSAGAEVRVAADPAGLQVVARRGSISPGFFDALGVRLRAGRPFSEHDTERSRVSIVNETLARLLFEGPDPLSRRIWIGQTPYAIVGVVADYNSNPLRADAEPKVFLPLPPHASGTTRLQVLIRARGNPAPLVQTVRLEVRDAATGTVVTSAVTFDQIIDVMSQEVLVGSAPLLPLIAIGMLLTAAGIYGTLAFAVTRRSRELAVRVVVGATRRDLVRLVTSATVRVVAVGAALGILATYALGRTVRASGGAGSVFDPPVAAFVAPILLVLVVGFVATWIPARRAMKIDPAAVLRTS